MHLLIDHLVSFIRHHPGHTATQIAEALLGPAGYHQRVGNLLRLLSEAGRIERRGQGGPGDPFKYYPPEKGP